MNEKLNKIIEKIQKLLALSESANQHEAELAASKAAELMQQYNISEAQIAGNSKPIIIRGSPIPWKRERWQVWLCSAIGEGYFVNFCHNQYKVWFIGREQDVRVAEYVYNQLATRLQAMARIAYKEYAFNFKTKNGVTIREYYQSRYQTKRLDYLHSWLEGASNALYHRLFNENKKWEEETKSTTALAIKPWSAIDEWMKENMRTMDYKSRFNRSMNNAAFQAGEQVGKSIGIHSGIGHQDNKQLGGK